MIKSFFTRQSAATAQAELQLTVAYTAGEDGISFSHESRQLVSLAGAERQRAAYLLQLVEDGYLRLRPVDLLLPWEQYFALRVDPEHLTSLPLLSFPPELAVRAQLASRGSLSDTDFQILISGWKLQDGRSTSGALERRGAFFRLESKVHCLPERTWRLLQEVKALAARQLTHRGEATNQAGWATIHFEAMRASAQFDGFLSKTIVLRPETLRLKPRKSTQAGLPLVEIIPHFDGAPPQWLSAFDGMQNVPDKYSIATEDGGITHVLVSPEVKAVLQQVRALPGRRVAGDRALQLLRNPYAVLGDDAVQVIDEQQFEQDRHDAGIAFLRFSLHPSLNDEGRIVAVDVHLDATSPGHEPVLIPFARPEEFALFVHELELKLAAGLPCGFWKGYELELADFDAHQYEGIRALLSRWQKQAGEDLFGGLFDLATYGDRVIGIGKAQAPNSPYLLRVSGEQWLPPALLNEMGLDGALLAQWDTDNAELLEEFKQVIAAARQEEQEVVLVPGLAAILPIRTAEAVAAAWTDKLKHRMPAPETCSATPDKSILQIEHNIEELGYQQRRAETLELATGTQAQIPMSLRSHVQLMDHQLHGVAWLQHLYRLSPAHTSGCLLADDMGLGKTLQLLTFIVQFFEDGADQDPVLIVAPVSLLDNWENELARFFTPECVTLLKLYGTELKAQKYHKDQLPRDITERGIFNLLKPGWRQGCQIVLTTYETLRDQEFSLARQPWSVVVCDEAQKIKNPTALVTQAARALPARFKIACTGTPVENSLVDLWCLFDFVQPGLLGALNEFGRIYGVKADKDQPVDNAVLDGLRALVEPQILRRLKTDVAKDLPAKIEATDCKALAMSPLQRKLYANEVTRYQAMQTAGELMGTGNAKILGLLHTMKMICAHPHSVYPEGELLQASPKMRWTMEQLVRIQAKQEKVIIFSELRDIQRALRLEILDRFGIEVTVINGDTNVAAEKGVTRQGLINDFQVKPGFGIIILSTTAVGFGVNVQEANHVIHFTRCWNPAKEDQATDRAYRIGQKRNVYVYCPTISGDGYESFEQKLDKLLSRKRSLAKDMLHGAGDLNVLDLVA